MYILHILRLKDAMQSRTFKKNRRMKIDNNEKYSDYLKKKFTSRYPRPAWADPKSDLEAAESDDEDLTKVKCNGPPNLVSRTQFLKRNSTSTLPKFALPAQPRLDGVNVGTWV